MKKFKIFISWAFLWTALIQVVGTFNAYAQNADNNSQNEINCLSLDSENSGKACLYWPSSDKPSGLIIFIRGHWRNYQGQVPSSLWPQSAKEALAQYGWRRFVEKTHWAVVILPSSHLSLSFEDYEKILEQHDWSHEMPVWLASHSGGYFGLDQSLKSWPLDKWPLIKKILMLDNFYSSNATLINNLKAYVQAGGLCQGFLTAHNLTRYQTYYASLPCPVSGPKGANHDGSVATCLLSSVLFGQCSVDERAKQWHSFYAHLNLPLFMP